MVVFDELRITKDLQYLIIRAKVRPIEALADVTIRRVYAYTYKYNPTTNTYVGAEQDSSLIFWDSDVIKQSGGTNYTGKKEVSIMIDSLSLGNKSVDFGKDLIFVAVEADESKVSTSVPMCCGQDKNPTIGVTLDMGRIYNMFMSHMKELGDTCEINKDLIDSILRWKVLTAAVDACHYDEAADYYYRWFVNGGKSRTTSTSNCGCHG